MAVEFAYFSIHSLLNEFFMRAIVLNQSGARFTADRPKPDPVAGEVLVKVLKAGICETDLQLIAGYMGFQGVLGHEFVGIAESGQYAGQRVVGEINCSCRVCDSCKTGLPNHCPTRSVLGILNHYGAFADFVAVPEINLHPVPDSVSTVEAVFTEPLAAAFQIPAQLDLNLFAKVVVLGDGRLGNLCAQVLKLSGCAVSVIGKHAEKLQRLSELGIETSLLQETTFNKTAGLVVDCTGSETGLPTAFQLVKPRGTIVLKTTIAGQQTLELAPAVIDEITIVGSRCGPFDQALIALSASAIDVRGLVSKSFPIEQAEEAFCAAREQLVLKVLFDLESE